MTPSHLLGLVASIVDNEPADWDYGCVLDSHGIEVDSNRFPSLLVLTRIILTTCS